MRSHPIKNAILTECQDREAAEMQICSELYGEEMMGKEFTEHLSDSEELEALVCERVKTIQMRRDIDALSSRGT